MGVFKLFYYASKTIITAGIDVTIYILQDEKIIQFYELRLEDQGQKTPCQIEVSSQQYQQSSQINQLIDDQNHIKTNNNQYNSNQISNEEQVDYSDESEKTTQHTYEIREQKIQEQKDDQINQNQNSSIVEENQNIKALNEEDQFQQQQNQEAEKELSEQVQEPQTISHQEQTEINDQTSESLIENNQQNNENQESNIENQDVQESKTNTAEIVQNNQQKLNDESQQNHQIDQEEPNQISQEESDSLEQTLQKLNEIFNRSYKARAVDRNLQDFVSVPMNQDELFNYYFPSKKTQFKKEIREIKKELNGYRRIRGDGNCFYTAFVYQYFNIRINDEQNKQEFIQKVSTLRIRINYQDIQIVDNIHITSLFLQQFEQIKTEQDLFEQIKNPDDIFYGLSIIVMRNYIADIYLNDDELKSFGNEQVLPDLLEWEKECNSNELIITGLAKQLNLQIIVHFFDMKNNLYKRTPYGENQELPRVILLLAPGHYQVGLQTN